MLINSLQSFNVTVRSTTINQREGEKLRIKEVKVLESYHSDMDNLDDSENNAKISDSAYSTSCSNSQSRRSHSSKSTHSGSSGSSGYGGKPSTSGSSNKLEQSRKDKDGKKKKQSQSEVKIAEESVLVECKAPDPIPLLDSPKENINKYVVEATQQKPLSLPDSAVNNMALSSTELANFKHEVQITTIQTITNVSLETSCHVANIDSEGFSCAISMHDGVVIYTTENMTTNLGFPPDMWIGRSFIDFVHPKDRTTFASQITNGLAIPKSVNETQTEDQKLSVADCKMVCRIRRYRKLALGFGVKDGSVAYMPFFLRFSFRNINNENKGKVVYLIIQAISVYSGYKTPNEYMSDATPFVIRHSAEGKLEYVDMESVQYLGYLPQDLLNMDALMLYHPDDLPYLKIIYEMVVKDGSVSMSKPYRMLAQNGDYVKLKTEWSSFINPWSMKLEFVIGKHLIIEGPATPDVFVSPPPKPTKISEEEKYSSMLAESHRRGILMILKNVLTKPTEKVKQQVSQRCQDLATIMNTLLSEQPSSDKELGGENQGTGLTCFERDSEMLGGISPHHDNSNAGSSADSLLSYNQLNYNDNLQRFFDSHKYYCDYTPKPPPSNSELSPKEQQSPESNDMSSIGSSDLMCHCFSLVPAPASDAPTMRLTESILTKHNNDMEKELAKCHRGTRSNKVEQAADTRQKKKEHLARCNATYQPTTAEANQSHGVKRSLLELEFENERKQHCSSRQARRRKVISADAAMSPAAAKVAAGIYPVYYAPNTDPEMMDALTKMARHPSEAAAHNIQKIPAIPPMPHCNGQMPWMYPQHVYGSPYAYHQVAYNLQHQQAMMAQSMSNQRLNPLSLPNNNYMQSTEKIFVQPKAAKNEQDNKMAGNNSDETLDRTDGGSSYSSFYSSFLRTDSGSAEDSSEPKKSHTEIIKRSDTLSGSNSYDPHIIIKAPKRNMDPPWMETVILTPELIFKYQMPTRSMEEVLRADMEKIKLFEQPALVNEQLGQLYLDLHLEGVASRLTLEEGSNSSSSSSDENGLNDLRVQDKRARLKRKFSQINLIYEADAPFPPSPSDYDKPCPVTEPEKSSC